MLAFEETGKYISERHAEAGAAGKLTAGNVAAILNRKFKPTPKIKAKELKDFADEWHHSGFYKGTRGNTMGRTYFFSPSVDFELLYKKVCESRSYTTDVAAEPDVERYFFSAGFEKLSRRSKWEKKWRVYAKFEAIVCKSSIQFSKKTEISKEDYELLKGFENYDLKAYETVGEFKNRMLKKEVA
uniref:Uncharacterized protein n=1 Tax=viral metagenome TaxID=1070528 RepID=A0A6M3JAE2_9ZZZZ